MPDTTPLDPRPTSTPAVTDPGDLDALLTVQEVAALLRVSPSWVYEHTRARGDHPLERLPYVKLGKYVRFDPRLVREFIVRHSRT
jgi:excisionase family DNA binding protein